LGDGENVMAVIFSLDFCYTYRSYHDRSHVT
jgi:hypothetical protein